MANLAPPSARAALDELVHQFADPYAFVRELVQNAIDAGSAEVEVDVRHEVSGSGDGVVSVHVDDWGDGMTREIIEKKLTRLFSSSKAGDRTKIGKFGIGFVSVFSLDPDAVCIDTSRDGQSWRILFKKDRSFELLTLAAPVDGTKIRVLKRGDTALFEEVRTRCERSLRFWCRHVEAEVRFAGAPIREAFGLPDTSCFVTANDGLTHIVVGHRDDGTTFRGYYNHGLTLYESGASAAEYPLDGIAFKASSPRLEHTLTRDAVIEDQGFVAVMREVVALTDGPLAEQVFERLEGDPTPYLVRAALCHVRRGRFSATVLKRRVATSPAGAAITVDMIRRGAKANQALYATTRTPLTDELERRGHLVLHIGEGDPRVPLLLALAPRQAEDTPELEVCHVGRDWCMPVVVDDPPRGWLPLREHLAAALRIIGAKVADIVAGDFAYPESTIADRIAVTQVTPGALLGTTELENLAPGMFSRKHVLVVNVAHASVHAFAALAEREPAVAAYLCIKAFRLGRGLDDDMDTKLVEHVVGERWPAATH